MYNDNARADCSPSLVLIRGIPGSGKSTAARRSFPLHEHVEADMYFTDFFTGKYRFNPYRLSDAHSWCQHITEKSLRDGKSVVVSNCFVLLEHMEPYLEIAKRCYIKEVEVYVRTHPGKSVHNVPVHTIERMRNQFEDYPDQIYLEYPNYVE